MILITDEEKKWDALIRATKAAGFRLEVQVWYPSFCVWACSAEGKDVIARAEGLIPLWQQIERAVKSQMKGHNER